MPKQVRPFLDNETLLQKTHNRLSAFLPAESIYLATGQALCDEISCQVSIEPKRFFVEPQRKDTAAAMALAAAKIFKENPEAILTNVWSDHYIGNVEAYQNVFEVASEFISQNPKKIFIAGVKPMYAETGYGYIKMGANAQRIGEHDIFEVAEFKEKPELKLAEEYVKNWEYLWNPAMFYFNVGNLIELYKEHAPEFYPGIMTIIEAIGTDAETAEIERVFASWPKVSFDVAIMEKASDRFVMPVDLGWSDVGHWKSIYDLLAQEDGSTVGKAKFIEIDSKNNLIFSETDQLISTIGIENALVIVSQDAILICDKQRAQQVKDLVAKLETDSALCRYT